MKIEFISRVTIHIQNQIEKADPAIRSLLAISFYARA